MADLSSLSDDEINKLYEQAVSQKQSAPKDLNSLSDQELDALYAQATQKQEPQKFNSPEDLLNKTLAPSDSFLPKVPLQDVSTGARSYLSGMTAGLSEPVLAGLNALTQAGFNADEFSKAYAADIERQKQQAGANPLVQGINEVAGAFNPLSVGSRIAKGAQEIIPVVQEAGMLKKAAQLGGQAALSGGAEQALMTSAQNIGKETSPATYLEDIGKTATFSGGVSSFVPIVRAAKIATTPGLRKASSAISNVAEDAKVAKNYIQQTFKPQLADDFERSAAIAEKIGINPEDLPEATKFGANSFASRAARAEAEGMLGQPRLDKFKKVADKTSEAFDLELNKLAGVDVKNISPVKIGEEIKDKYLSKVDDTIKQADATYRGLSNQLGEGASMPTEVAKNFSKKISEVEARANSLLASGSKASEAQAKEILANIKKLKSLKTLNDQVTFMQTIGKEAYDKSSILQGQLRADTKSKRKIYDALREGITDSFRVYHGEDVANKLLENNKALTELFSDQNLIGKQIKSAKSGEEIFNNLIDKGTSSEIEALTKYVPEETIRKAKAAYLNSIAGRNNQGQVIFDNLPKKLEKKSLQIGNLFSQEELAPFADISQLGSTYGQPTLSSSGTGGSISFIGGLKSLPEKVAQKKVLENITNTPLEELRRRKALLKGK